MSSEPYVVVWRKAIMASRLPSTTRHVAHAIVSHADADGSRCHPGIRALAKATKLSAPTIQKAVEILEAGGWILRTERVTGRPWRGRQGVNPLYHLLIPAAKSESPNTPTRRKSKRRPSPAQLAALATGRANRLGEVSNGVAHPPSAALESVQNDAVEVSNRVGPTRTYQKVSSREEASSAHVGAGTRGKASDTRTTAATDSAETYHPEDLRRIAAGLPPRPAAVRAAEAATLTTDDEGFKV